MQELVPVARFLWGFGLAASTVASPRQVPRIRSSAYWASAGSVEACVDAADTATAYPRLAFRWICREKRRMSDG